MQFFKQIIWKIKIFLEEFIINIKTRLEHLLILILVKIVLLLKKESKGNNNKTTNNKFIEGVGLNTTLLQMRTLIYIGWGFGIYLLMKQVNPYTILWTFQHLIWILPFLIFIEIFFNLISLRNIFFIYIWNSIKNIRLNLILARFYHIVYTYMALCINYIFYFNIEIYVYTMLFFFCILIKTKSEKLELALHFLGLLFLYFFILNDFTFEFSWNEFIIKNIKRIYMH